MNTFHSFHFGRLNLVAYAPDKIDFIGKSLDAEVTVKTRGYDWGFFDIDKIVIESQVFYIGKLVKSMDVKDEDIIDRDDRQIKTVSIKDRAICSSDFFIHPKSGVIAYHPIANKIGKNQFRRIYARLIEEANDSFFIDADIQVINDENEFMELFNKFTRIEKLVIDLHPTNPGGRNFYEPTDKKIQRLKADTYTQIYKSNQGLQIDRTLPPYSDIIMAGDGYGKATVSGDIDGEKRTANTEETQLVEKAPLSENQTDLLNYLFKTFISIWERIDNG